MVGVGTPLELENVHCGSGSMIVVIEAMAGFASRSGNSTWVLGIAMKREGEYKIGKWNMEKLADDFKRRR